MFNNISGLIKTKEEVIKDKAIKEESIKNHYSRLAAACFPLKYGDKVKLYLITEGVAIFKVGDPILMSEAIFRKQEVFYSLKKVDKNISGVKFIL